MSNNANDPLKEHAQESENIIQGIMETVKEFRDHAFSFTPKSEQANPSHLWAEIADLIEIYGPYDCEE